MPARKLTLEEWFLAYQLRRLGRDHFFSPLQVEVDVTPLWRRYRAREERPPLTALLVKALALAARRLPEINRVYLRTFYGDRIVEFDTISVNLPFVIEEDGRPHVSAMVVREADRAPLAEIRAQIRAARAKTIDQTRLTRVVVRRPNNALWRLVLRLIHFVVYNFSGPIERHGGGLSVSTLPEAHGPFGAVSFGPTAVTLFSSGARHSEAREDKGERFTLALGLGVDHSIIPGITMQKLVGLLREILGSADPERLRELEAA